MYLKKNLIVLLCLIAFQADAQMGIPFHHVPRAKGRRSASGAEGYMAVKESGNENAIKMYKRNQIGFSYIMTSGTLNYHYKETYYDYNASKAVKWDTTIKMNMRTQKSYGIVEGIFIPVTKLSDNAILDIAVDVVWNRCLIGGVEMKRPYGKEIFFDISSTEFGVPVALEYKTGGEVSLNKSKGSMFTIGVGIHPRLVVTKFSYLPTGTGAIRYLATPFARAEVGFFAGIAWKLRATLYPGGIRYLTGSYQEALTDYPLNATYDFQTKTSVSLALLLLPFSWDWEKSEW